VNACVDSGLDVDATADPPATGNFGPLVVPFFRGKVCIATKAKPGEAIPLSITPCLHPCISNVNFKQKNIWRCEGITCEGLNMQYVNASGVGCPADVFGRFDASMCTYDLTVKASQGPFNPNMEDIGGDVTTEVPFLSNAEMDDVANGASNDSIWSMVNAYPADDERIFTINLSDANPSAPADCTTDPSLCECFNIGV